MKRVDSYPTHEKDGVKYRAGHLMPFGATLLSDEDVNFSIYSKDATYCELVLFHIGDEQPFAVIPLIEFKVGCVYAVTVIGINWEELEYGYRFDGPRDSSKGYRFDRSRIVLDPYARLTSGRDVWHERTYGNSRFPRRGRIIRRDYFWDGDKPLNIPMKDLVIYEMHVRGFTADQSSGVKNPGVFAGIVEKIPYLKDLGINCVELLPIFEFEEFFPQLDDSFCNYWGYSPCNYFSPKTGYAASGPFGMAVDEFKNLVRLLHQAGIEVFLDIVFNHTSEGGPGDDFVSFSGIDNRTYYVLKPDGTNADYTGCGNTFNCNNPVVRNFIKDSLRYWVSEYHIDGFRVDEAPIFARGEDGNPIVSPPLVDELKNDPILLHTKFISEGWDVGGLSSIGKFPPGWADWNPRMRDAIKRFIKGMPEALPELLDGIKGSPDLFPGRSADSSVNYVCCHDGLNLYDTVSYNDEHNETNAYYNGKRSHETLSWNCGVEGETDDRWIMDLRVRQIKNCCVLLMLSRGVPMLFAGDEFGNTQYGNSNCFSQDNRTSWLKWDRLERFAGLHEFWKAMINFRMKHPVLRRADYFTGYNSSGYPELSWHGERAWNHDENSHALVFGFMYAEPAADFGTDKDYFIYCGVNSHWENHTLELPIVPEGMQWRVAAYTGDKNGSLTGCTVAGNFGLMPRSSVVLVASRP